MTFSSSVSKKKRIRHFLIYLYKTLLAVDYFQTIQNLFEKNNLMIDRDFFKINLNFRFEIIKNGI